METLCWYQTLYSSGLTRNQFSLCSVKPNMGRLRMTNYCDGELSYQPIVSILSVDLVLHTCYSTKVIFLNTIDPK